MRKHTARKLPRWVLDAIVVVGFGWLAAQTGIFGRLTDSLAAGRTTDYGTGARQGGAIAAVDKGSRVTQSSYRLVEIEKRRIVESVQATGVVAPVALVSVSSQVSGQVKEIYADFNQEVHKGDPIALIDPLSFEIAAEQSDAQVGIAKAEVLKAQVTLRDAEAESKRKEALASHGAGSQADQGKAEANRDLAAAQVDNATHALVSAEAALKQAHADLDHTIIRSPVDGTIIVRNIEVGTTVAVSLQAPVLFSIAQDLRQMQVNTSIPESEIGRIRVGQKMEFAADSYPGRVFSGEVVQIRKQPQISQNVVTYTVVASAPNPELLLLPGMTATARIIIDETDGKLSVPTAALRFRPPGEPRNLGSRVFIDQDGRPVAVSVELGPTDGAFTIVKSDRLKAKDRVITGLAGGVGSGAAPGSGGLLGIF
ncbi:efflux RND transporter periplasmic adaptor subunit [Mesorhizobium abyssinicae]|uniref:Efflux RND transporter periplasmic adaptor subunit n=1 Tax=Mesorhizobium abyssinicae TaxID=1209958 RepID=A0ABU5AXQ3_9HYPH|nr:efflux RND transporter periplasmic adaptor subunit [Mesorhizobium abyssinicae]MDX8437569.1 efflux RND transporter periplasmic adaptor subunit [Mesorhizobium abyssinicae]MDX8542001.1 efflux RND transporter periplasmic adaptor subunit [Mesorhizobium abyssinicae]